MIGLEVIKQGLENNKKGISSNLLKKIASLKIEERFQNSLNSYSIISMTERIAESDLDDKDKETLMKMLKDGLDKTLNEMKDSLKELFGSKEEKEASVEDDGDKQEDSSDSEDKEDSDKEEDDEDKQASVTQSYFNY